ncbi:MAG: glutamate synthase small subunit, partial [Proteobacteria bacterium]|nr:glutamate synthase small subunit [Pseudomonadota bacterium]
MLFTQPRSPYFYGKLRVNGRYITKSFAPVEDYDAALEMLYKWREEIFGENKNNFNIGSSSKNTNYRDEYLSHEKLDNDFQFLEV